MNSGSKLNPAQLKAVALVDHHLLVVAGAGSGKTRVLTHKIAYLIENCSVPPYGILAMTFSNQAAREMKDRVAQLLPTFEQPHWVGTFHSICLRLLKEFAREAELSPFFSIYDETDQLTALKRALADCNCDPKQIPPKSIRHQINAAKNESTDVVSYLANHSRLSDRALGVVTRYQEILKTNQALDFGDLLTKTLHLLRNQPRVQNILRDRFVRILIDEYQDTNRIQMELIKALTGNQTIVCAVGDEDQSIYGWRGARVENILEFEADFPGAQITKLEQNYRSTQQILSAANHLISHNIGRRGKELWTENGEGSLVIFHQADDDRQEAIFVLDEIEKQMRGGVQPRDVAIFYRTHAQSRLLEEECRRRNRPYRVFGGIRFFDRAEVKDTLAFLKHLLNPTDRVSFERIVNVPARGIGDKTVEMLYQTAHARNLPAIDAIPFFAGRGKAHQGLQTFHAWFKPLQAKALHSMPAPMAELVLQESGYLQMLEDEATLEAESKLDNLQELLRSMRDFAEETKGTLADYLDRISLVSDTDAMKDSPDAVTLMTVHNSKGLEFSSVFVVGMEEGLFPHQRSIQEGGTDEIEEERRLCYVAMTRAQRQLTLTAAYRRRLYQSNQFNPISRFVEEIPQKHLQMLGERFVSSPRKPHSPAIDEYRQDAYHDDEEFSDSPYIPGACVMHPDFGVGTIKRCEGRKDNLKLTIAFKNVGVKKVLLNYCSLEVVGR